MGLNSIQTRPHQYKFLRYTSSGFTASFVLRKGYNQVESIARAGDRGGDSRVGQYIVAIQPEWRQIRSPVSQQ